MGKIRFQLAFLFVLFFCFNPLLAKEHDHECMRELMACSRGDAIEEGQINRFQGLQGVPEHLMGQWADHLVGMTQYGEDVGEEEHHDKKKDEDKKRKKEETKIDHRMIPSLPKHDLLNLNQDLFPVLSQEQKDKIKEYEEHPEVLREIRKKRSKECCDKFPCCPKKMRRPTRN